MGQLCAVQRRHAHFRQQPAQLSVLDYIGEVPWDKTDENGQPLYEETKNWYARIKSRPSFKPLLADRLANLVPAPHYTNLDF